MTSTLVLQLRSRLIPLDYITTSSLKQVCLFLLTLPLLVSCQSNKPLLEDTKQPDVLDISRSDKLPDHDSLMIKKQLLSISSYPEVISKDCNDGNAKLYNECADQTVILTQAIAAAEQQDKNVLIIYGGEWCIWCHVLDRYFKGQFRTFDYQWRDSTGDMSQWLMREEIGTNDIVNAVRLNHFVANNFVIAHIDGSYANGDEAIAMTGLDPDSIYYYPYVIALDKNGKYAGNMPSTDAIEDFEIRESGGEEFRGYNRKILLEQVTKLKAQALANQ